jgi:hypothetical protein
MQTGKSWQVSVKPLCAVFMEININDFKCEQTGGQDDVYSCTAVSVY